MFIRNQIKLNKFLSYSIDTNIFLLSYLLFICQYLNILIMQVGQTNLPISQAIIGILLIISLICNIFLFSRGHQSYSIKYQLFLNDKNLRKTPGFVTFIQGIYKSFFVLPFILLLALAISRALYSPEDLPVIFVNGLIVLLITYPFKSNLFFIKMVAMWVLAIASQFISLFLQSGGSDTDYYTLLCAIFYPINSVLFCLALLSRESEYWEIQEALSFQKVEKQLASIYPAFVVKTEEVIIVESKKKNKRDSPYLQEPENEEKTIFKFTNIPEIFNGGIYGSLCRERQGWKFTLLYLISLCILALNAIIIWNQSDSSLGVIGLITNFIYDLFIFSFNILATPQRSIRNVFILVFAGRLLSFAFGKELWIFGYCVLYLFVGIFIGRILVNSRLPLRNIKKQQKSKKQINAFRTPQFVLFILTVQIFFLVLASSLGVGGSSPTVDYSSQVSIPLWQFALLAVIATWIIIAFLASSRMYERHLNNIKDSVEFFFGSKKIREYHIYFLVTYVFIIGLGLYCYYFLKNTVAFFSSIFLPLIYWSALKLFNQWKNNEYQIFADIPSYNRRVQKKAKIFERKQKALSKQTQKRAEIEAETSKILIKTSQQFPQNSKSQLLMKNEMNIQILSNDEALDQIQLLIQQKNQYATLQDWRLLQGSLSVFQLWECLTPFDKSILIMILSLFFLFIGFILTTYLASSSIFGIFIITCLVSIFSVMPYYRFACTFKEFTYIQYIWSEIGLAFGVLYWSFYYKQAALAMVWAVVHIFAFSIMLSYGIAKRIEKKLVYILIFNVFLTICFICIFLALTNDAIVAIIVSITLFMICVGAIPVAFQHIQGHLPNYIKIICGVVIGGGIAGLSIASVLLNFASNFAVFSFDMCCLYLILSIIGLSIFYQKQSSKYDNPMVYSAFGEPIYRFDSSSQQLKSSRNHKIILDLASAVLVVYGATIALIFKQKQWAIYSLALYCCHTFFQDILFSLKTYEEIAAKPLELTQQLMLLTLKQLKEKYMIDFTHNKYSNELQKLKDQKKDELQTQTDPQKLDVKWLQVAKINNESIKNREQQQKFLFFWIALIQFHIFSKQKQKMVNFLNHAKQIEEELIQIGIFIDSLSYAIDFLTKYQLVTQEVQNLNPVDYINFHALLKKQQLISKQSKHIQLAQGDNIQKQQQEKQKRMYENLQQEMKRSTSQKITEFQEMVAGLGKKLFEDTTFPRNFDSLGDLEGRVTKWRRPSSKEVLVKDSISPYDVRQGSIGNCYLISALGVLGEQWILKALGSSKEEGKSQDKKWKNQKGAYMVRFYKFSKEIYVTIDDYLPVNQQDGYVFAKSEDQYELWPCIIQKAYAKLYGGYSNIESGKCHSVLAEFTNGIPFQFFTKDYEANPNGLWQKILSAKNNNYLMAAGSQMNENGDLAFSKRNIVFGHAYSILDVREVEGYKLMKLKNPHGSGKKEWSGDFSDGSEFMNDRMMQLLGHEKKDDGVFWMKMQDFMHQFRSLFVCAIFDESLFKKQSIEGEFNQQNSYGTPSKSEQTFKNPQYGIVATKKSTLFINLTQKDRNEIGNNTFQGKNTIFLRVYKSNGKRISNYNKNEPTCGLPQQSKRSISISMQVQLQADSFPYTFTLYTSCLNEGDTGAYKLDIYCSDKDFKLIRHEEFDRQHF